MYQDAQTQLLHADVLDFAVPVAFVDRTLDLVLSSVVFFYTLLQQNELEKNVHMIAVLGLMFATYAAISSLHDRINSAVGAGRLVRQWIPRTMLRLLYLAMAFLSGLFVRLVSEPIVHGPHAGPFSIISLLWPLSVVVVLVSLFAHINLSTEMPAHFSAALQREDAELVRRTDEVMGKH